jgi:hypothetical protein
MGTDGLTRIPPRGRRRTFGARSPESALGDRLNSAAREIGRVSPLQALTLVSVPTRTEPQHSDDRRAEEVNRPVKQVHTISFRHRAHASCSVPPPSLVQHPWASGPIISRVHVDFRRGLWAATYKANNIRENRAYFQCHCTRRMCLSAPRSEQPVDHLAELRPQKAAGPLNRKLSGPVPKRSLRFQGHGSKWERGFHRTFAENCQLDYF